MLLQELKEKIDMAKITIAQLQDKISRLEADKQSWYEKYRELKNAEENRNQFKIGQLDEEKKQNDRQIANLLEVIRWQIYPSTAKAPFMPTKDEREDTRRIY